MGVPSGYGRRGAATCLGGADRRLAWPQAVYIEVLSGQLEAGSGDRLVLCAGAPGGIFSGLSNVTTSPCFAVGPRLVSASRTAVLSAFVHKRASVACPGTFPADLQSRALRRARVAHPALHTRRAACLHRRTGPAPRRRRSPALRSLRISRSAASARLSGRSVDCRRSPPSIFTVRLVHEVGGGCWGEHA